jgi:hypothetical protein
MPKRLPTARIRALLKKQTQGEGFQRKKKRWLLLLLLTAVVILTGGIWRWYQNTVQAFATSHILLVLPNRQADQPFTQLVVVLLTENSPSMFIRIPTESSIETVGNYGQYPAQSLARFFEQEQPDSRYLQSTISVHTGVWLQETIWLTDDFLEQAHLLSGLFRLLQTEHSSLGIMERFVLWQKISSQPLEEYSYQDLLELAGSTSTSEKQVLFKRSQFFLPELTTQPYSVVIVNASGTPEVGTVFAERVKSAGFRVVGVEAAESVLDANTAASQIIVSNQSFKTHAWKTTLSAIYPDLVDIVYDPAKTERLRTDIILVLGAEFSFLGKR